MSSLLVWMCTHFLVMFCLLVIDSSCCWWEATWVAPWQSGSLFGCVTPGTKTLWMLGRDPCSAVSRNLKLWWWVVIVCVMTFSRNPAEHRASLFQARVVHLGRNGFCSLASLVWTRHRSIPSHPSVGCPGRCVAVWLWGNKSNVTLEKVVLRQGVLGLHYGHRVRSFGSGQGLGCRLRTVLFLSDKLCPSWFLPFG